MSKHISEESKGPRKGHAAGDTSIEQQASQLASDIKYKARQKMKAKSGSNLSPGQVQALYRSLLASSPAPGGVKALVKKKLFGEQVDRGEMLVNEIVEDTRSSVFGRVFGGEEIEEAADQKFVIRVTDKATGNTSYRKADRAKIAELRANKNISSVEITGRKKADDAYGEKHEKKYGPAKGKNTVGDKDGDGTKEPDRHEYAGVKDRAIKKAMAKEEVIYEKEEGGEKKLDVMKGKNKVKVNPTIGESIRAELDALKAQKVEEAAAAAAKAGPSPEERQQLMNKDKMLKRKIMMQKQTMQMQKQGRLPLNYSEEAEKEGCGCGKTPCECGKMDEREEPTKASLFKNKLRARGIKVAGLSLAPRNMKTYDDLGEAVANKAEYEKVAKEPAPKDDKKLAYQFKDNKRRQRDLKKLARLVRHADGMKKNPAMYDSFEAEGEMVDEGLGKRLAAAGAAGAIALGSGAMMGKKVSKDIKQVRSGSGVTRVNTLADKISKRNAMLKQLQNQSFEPEGEVMDEASPTGYNKGERYTGKAGAMSPEEIKKANKGIGERIRSTIKLQKAGYEPEGEMTEEASDRARDEHQMRGGMAARKDYDRPPAKKLSNKELGIKPGKTWVQKQMEKK